jgi:mono/diheme cytochrome c family protein
MRKKTCRTLLTAAAIAGAALVACPGAAAHGYHWEAPKAAAERKNPVPADSASLERGKKIFATNCAVCHGSTGRGDGPAAAGLTPKPADLREMAAEHPDGNLAWKIANGRGPMPAWKGTLNERQIWDVVNYLKSLHGADR